MASLRNRFLYFGGAIFLCALISAVVFFYADYVSFRAMPTRPLVQITETLPEDLGVASQPVVVFAQASDPDGIAKVELWVNGQQVGAQTNPNQTSPLPFATSQAWIPNGAGNYLIVLKAIDGAGFLGESEPLIVQVQERKYEPDPQVSAEYQVQEGDTLESIASSLGTTPEDLSTLNPGIGEVTPGSTVLVPPRPEEEAGSTAAGPPAPGGEAIPVVDPPPPPTPGEGTEAEPASEEWWAGLPLPENFVCLFRSEVCRRAIDLELAPSAPIYIFWDDLVGSCGIEVNWTDQSENEDGFRIYRFTNRPRFRLDLLEIVGPSEGTGTVLFYQDENPPRGEFFYAVVAYNAGGDSWSAPSEMIEDEGCSPPESVDTQALVVEGLAINVIGSFDRLYCYASLADAPFERVPAGARSFINFEAGTWNIAEHFSGSNKREVMAPVGSPLNIGVECLGWQGEELVNLGRFARSHPASEWDGRPLTAGPDSGAFSLTYRIEPSFHAAEEGGRAAWPLVDPGMPAPYNLRTAVLARCDGFDPCGGTLLVWEYRLPAGAPSSPTAYKVYQRLPGGTVPHLYYTTPTARQRAPLAGADCNTTVYYSVSAVVGSDPVTGEEIQSPLSEEFEILPTCASLEITLETLWIYGVDDGDPCTVFDDCRNDYEAYGWLEFNGQRIRWNDHCDGSCVYVAPSFSRVREASSFNWSGAMLNIGDGWRRGNNVIRIPIEDGEALNLIFTLMDHDDWSADDPWCGGTGRPEITLPARPAPEWRSLDESFVVDTARRGGQCLIQFRIRGTP